MVAGDTAVNIIVMLGSSSVDELKIVNTILVGDVIFSVDVGKMLRVEVELKFLVVSEGRALVEDVTVERMLLVKIGVTDGVV